MQAVLLKQESGRRSLVCERQARPLPRQNEALIRVHSISVNYADILVKQGRYPYMPDLPAMPGAECSGYVERVGSNSLGLETGQAVVVVGKPCYANYITATKPHIFPLPDGVDMEKAAALPVAYLTAYHLLHTVRRVRAGEKALVYAAAGGVGSALLQLAALAKVEVIGLCSSQEKVDWLNKQACWKAINYHEENVIKRVLELTHGQGVDVIFDSVAGDTFKDNFQMLNALGHLVWFGVAAGMPRTNILKVFARNPAQSAAVSVFHLFSIMRNLGLLRRSMNHLLGLLARGRINPPIGHRLPLHQAARAQELIESRQTIGKVILQA